MATPGPPQIFQPRAKPNTLEFRWTPPTNPNGTILGYRLQLNESLTYILQPGLRYYVVSGLSNGVWYNATIEASNANGYGEKAYYRPFQPGSPPPLPPSSISVEYSPGSSSALVSWTPPTTQPDAPIYWYPIYATSSDSNYPVRKYTGDATSQQNYYIFNDLNPNSNSDYTFSVYAANCPGWSIPRSIKFIGPKLPLSVNWATRMNFTNVMTSMPYVNSSICSDSSDNVIVFGTGLGFSSVSARDFDFYNYTNGNFNVNLSSRISVSNTTITAYICKYDSSGQILWTVPITASGTSLQTSSSFTVNSDNSGNIYIMFASSVATLGTNTYIFYNYAGKSGNTVNLTTYGTYTNNTGDIILLKYNPNGIIEWFTCINGTGSQSFFSINETPNSFLSVQKDTDAIYLTCIIPTNTNITVINSRNSSYSASTGAIQVTEFGRTDGGPAQGILFVKYNKNGICQWVNRIAHTTGSGAVAVSQGACESFPNGKSIFTFSYGNVSTTLRTYIYTYSNVSGSTIQYNSNYVLPATPNTGRIATLIQFSSSNTVDWVTRIIGNSTSFTQATYIKNLSALSDNSTIIGLQTASTSVQSYSLESFSSFSGSNIIFSSSLFNLNIHSGVGIFKVNSNGVFLNGTYLYTPTSNAINITSIKSKNSIYITGYTGTPTSTLVLPSASSNFTYTTTGSLQLGSTNSYILKYDSNLQFEVANKLDILNNIVAVFCTDPFSKYVYLGGTFAASNQSLNVYNYSNITGSNVNVSLAGTLASSYTTTSGPQRFLIQYNP